MKIIKDVVFRTVAGESMLVPVGETVGEFNGIFTLSETGAEIWRGIESGLCEEEIVQKLLGEFDTDEKTAREDADAFLEKLCSMGLLQRD